MKTITLNTTKIFEKNHTSKYWRDIECLPQSVDLRTWSDHNPLFVLKGTIVRSHDEREIGQLVECYVQTYSFWLENEINGGIYSIR